MDPEFGELVADAAVQSSIWSTPSVSEQPSIILVRWCVMESQAGDRYFVGFNVIDQEGRASTAIKRFDPKSLTGVTESGRLYRLVGPPGYDPDGCWVWSQWARFQQLQWRDVTSKFTSSAE